MAKRKRTFTGIERVALILISLCILLVLAYQVQTISSAVVPEPTRTPIQPYVDTIPDPVEVEQEDELPTLTPTMPQVGQ